MEIVRSEKYRDSFKPQPWHSKLEEAKSFFESRYHQDITSERGFESVMATEGWRDQYNDYVASLVTDEATRDIIKKVTRHSMEDVRNPLAVSTEATDTLANNANYSALAKLNSWIIVGYTARSKCLELYHTFSSDDPTVSFKYNISYIKKANDPEEYIRPNADRDGDIGPLYDLPIIAPVLHDADPAFAHLEQITGVSLNGKNDIWIKINPGIMGNLFDDNGGEFDPTKYTLEKNPTIVGVYYDLTDLGADDDDETGIVDGKGYVKTYSERQENTGEQQKKNFYAPLTIPYKVSDVSKSVDAVIMGVIDLDTGAYQFSAIGPITHIQLDIRVTNVANELGTIRAGNRTIVETFSVDNHPYGTVPVVPEMSDDFNAGGSGVSATAFFTDQVTGALASMRDIVMERELDTAYEKGPTNHRLYAKLGGFKGNVSFPLAARLAGGSDPFSWMTIGLKNTIVQHLTMADMSCYFEDNIPRQWYILGAEYDINRIPDFTYSDWDGKDAGQAEKYGFTLDGSAGFMDNHQRSVRVIGSSYRRHYQNKQGQRLPMRVSLKSLSLEQPTSVYLPYSFRVYAGIMTEYSKRTGLIIAARDCIRTLSCVQSRISLVGNNDNLYNAICSWDSGSSSGSSTGPGSSEQNPVFTKTVAGGAVQNVHIASVEDGAYFPPSS
jgi:hypothetical protein